MGYFKVIFLLLLIQSSIHASDKKEYVVADIPANLLKNANAVIRYDETRFEMISLDKSKLYTKIAITILNEQGSKFAAFSESYDKLRKIENFEGRLFDANGIKIKTVKKIDIQDLSGTDDGTLADDNRIKAHNFYYKTYPYTIEYETEIEYKGSLIFPRWFPIPTEKVAIEKSFVSVTTPLNYKVNFNLINLPEGIDEKINDNKKTIQYTLTNKEALVYEALKTDWLNFMPSILFNPTYFKWDGFEGDFSSWKSFGAFIFNLNKGRDVLPSNTIKEVHEIVDKLNTDKAKINALYQYMQKNTRYISVQLGIGGLQPFDATYVATKKYGDCKALTNFMYSILKEVGIKSHYTLIKAGEDEKAFLPDFPFDFFNHIILAVPQAKDTLWLECTSQTLAPGYLSNFTDDRYALMVDENGGHLVKTPRYNYNDNLQTRIVKVDIEENGNAKIYSNTSFRAMAQDDIHGLIHSYTKEKVKEYLNRNISLANYELEHFNYIDTFGKLPIINESLIINASNFATITGKRIFITPNLFNKTGFKLSVDTSRKSNFQLQKEYTDLDSVYFKLPKGYTPESIPNPINIQSKFGIFNCSVEINGDNLTYYRKIIRFKGTYPANEYNDLVSFVEQVYKADRRKLVFVKKDAPSL